MKIENRKFRTRKTSRTYFANAFMDDPTVDPIVYAFYAPDIFRRMFPIRDNEEFGNTIEGAKKSLRDKVKASKPHSIVWI